MENILDLVKIAASALDEKKAIDIEIIDIQGLSVLADYFIIASASNANQLSAMQDAVDEAMHKQGLLPKQVEGNNKSTWILMDYGDIIVHLFSEDDRLFYNLEKIWIDGKRMSLDELNSL